jgi:hypothetical protein
MTNGSWAATIGVVGGIVGLLGGLMSFRDRFYKGRPVASLSTRNSSGRNLVLIRIKNTTDYDIYVKGATEWRGIYFLTEDATSLNIVRGQLQKSMFTPFMLKPNETKELLIMPKYKDGVAVEASSEDRYFAFWLHWRRGNATWLPQIPVPVWTNTGTIRQLGEAA